MALINPYIHFNGNAEEAFTFYKSVFGGAFAKIARYKDEYPAFANTQTLIRKSCATAIFAQIKNKCKRILSSTES